MKNLIFTTLIIGTLLFTGCSEREAINIYEEDNADLSSAEFSEEQKNVLSDNNDDTAENNNSRPFVVFVTGRVKNPGVYELKEGSRVIDAIAMAGGYEDDAYDTILNLASLLQDEDMIYVPSFSEIEENDGSNVKVTSVSNKSSTADLVNINKASKEELMTLPGIGESKAEKIINYRAENGPFSSPEGIMQISGIKDGLFNKIKDRICAK